MKGKEIIAHAVRVEMPDMEQLRERSIQQATKKETAKHSAWAKRLIPLAACLAVVLAVSIIFPYIINNDTPAPETTSGGKYPPLVELSMRGLPVENFSLANVENGGAMMSRIAFMNFGAMFEWGADCFAVVKVYDVESTKSNESHSFNEQISNAAVLQAIYGCEDFAESIHIQIGQSIIENHFCLGTTNLLRKGGVYLLPLKQADDKWYIIGDMDVLFEIDDKGRVWSHSDFEDFKRHDGKSIETFIEDLQNMFSDEDFTLANSPFAGTLRGWTLADIKVTSAKKAATDRSGQPCFRYEFAVNEIFSDPNHENSTPLGKTGRITVYADEPDPIEFIDGNRYLICLDRYEGEIYVNSRMIAEIGNDDTITVIPSYDNSAYLGASIFTPYNGYKISDIRGMVLRIEEWHEAQK